MSSKAIFSWSRGTNGPSVNFEVRYQIGNGDFIDARTNKTSFEINDLKPDREGDTAIAINLNRNEGIENVKI